MKKKAIVVGTIVLAISIIFLSVYFITRPSTLGNINYSCRQSTSSISDFTFNGESGDNLKFSFSSDIESGTLDITLCDSQGNVVYMLDSAKESVTWFVLEKTDTYSLVAEYNNFIGKFKIKVTK